MRFVRIVLVALIAWAVGVGAVGAPVARADDSIPVPADTGMGKRVVYDMGQMRVWLVEADESVTRTYLVSGHEERTLPGTGTFWVYSKVRWNTVKDNPDVKLDFMIRFAIGDEGLSIGFHAIPRTGNVYAQSTSTLGQPASHGCVRQAPVDAEFLWEWAGIGTPVVVVDTTGRLDPAPSRRYPRETPPPAVLNPWAGKLPAVGTQVWLPMETNYSGPTLFSV